MYFFKIFIFGVFALFIRIGQHMRQEAKWKTEGGWDRERSARWDSNSGQPICWCPAHESIGADKHHPNNLP